MAENEKTTTDAKPARGSLRSLRAGLKRWSSVAEDPTRWGALEASDRQALGESLRDLFVELSARKAVAGDDDRLAQALLAAIEPAPTATVEGLAVSFHPGGRFRAARFLDEEKIDPPLRPLFARPRARGVGLLTAFVDPVELSFRTFENILPLDRLLDGVELSFELRDGQALGAGVCSFALGASEATREALAQLDTLDLYTSPLNAASRGGQRYIFHSARLSEALTRAVRAALPAEMQTVGRFSHVNPVFRCNRFEPGDEKFHRHMDSPYFDRSRRHVSRHTVLIYLTGGRGSPALRFSDGVELASIAPLTCVVFDQSREHEGASYDDGRKVFLRTELVFEVDEVVDHPGLGQLFAKATYLTGESLFAPALSAHADRCYNRVAAAHWTGDTGRDEEREPFLLKRFRGVTFVANGYDFWFPKAGLSLAECAALTLLDYFNAKVDGAAFRAQCETEVVHAGEPGWIARRLASEPAPGQGLAPIEREALLPRLEEPADSEEVCCPFHCGEVPAREAAQVIRACKKAYRQVKDAITSAPVVVMGEQVMLDPKQFVVEAGRIQVLSARSLSPVNFASCDGEIHGILSVGVKGVAEVLQPLVPPILFVEEGDCVHLMFDFFRNAWMVDPGERTMPVPQVLDMSVGEAEYRGVSPWKVALRASENPEAMKRAAGVQWWLEHPVRTKVRGKEVTVSDPSTSPEALSRLLDSKHLEVQVAAAANPNLPLDALARLLDVVDLEVGEDGRSEVTIAAWQNPSMPLLMMSDTGKNYSEWALEALLWLEQYHGAALSMGEEWSDLKVQLARWAQPSASRPRLGDAIVRDFARLLAGLFGLPWNAPEA